MENRPGMNLEIFKSGTHTTMDGKRLSFSEADIQATKDAYDPAVVRAPLVVGHPKTDDPAYGWVSSLDFSSNVLTAAPNQVEPEFAEMVNSGRFPKISASFFHPESPSNPKPGVWYLRHVGFLGAAAPAVKGLKEASFSDGGEGVVTVEFADTDFDHRWVISKVLRNLRDWMLEKFGAEEANKVVQDWMAREAEDQARPEDRMAFADSENTDVDTTQPEETTVPPNKDDQVNAEFAERETALQARQAELDARDKALADKEKAARNEEIASFADKLVAEGKLLPGEKDGVVSFMQGLAEEHSVSFADGEQAVEKTGQEFFREFLNGLPTRVDFAERGAVDDEDSTAASFSAPQGFSVDPERLALHNKALSYQAQHNCDYNTALAAVS